MRVKRFLSFFLSLVLTFSLVHGISDGPRASAMGEEIPTLRNRATLEIVSRRVSKPELYESVPDEQKTVRPSNPIAVVNGRLDIKILDSDVIDYIRFSGDTGMPTQRKADVTSESIHFLSSQSTIAAVTDWDNLSIAVNNEPASTTATNFQGEDTTLTFTVPTILGEERTLTIYAGGHPHTGTITTTAALGSATVPVVVNGLNNDEYAFTPNSSQIVDYQLNYTGTGEDLVITFTLKGTQDVSWAGIAVAGAVLRGADDSEGPSEPDNAGSVTVVEKVVSNPSLYNTVPSEQKTVSKSNPVAVTNEVLNLDLTSSSIIDFLCFTGSEEPVHKNETDAESLSFTAAKSDISSIHDWTNMQVKGADALHSATNFLGEGADVTFSVSTTAGTKRVLDLYVGGHPNRGTYTVSAALGREALPITAGSTVSTSYSYSPASSQIVHYRIRYTGNGEKLTFKVSLSGIGNVNWAGIGVSAAVLRDDVSSLSQELGFFNKNPSDVEHTNLSTEIYFSEGVTFHSLKQNDAEVSRENYIYDIEQSSITLRSAYLDTLSEGTHEFKVILSDGQVLPYTVVVSNSANAPRPYVKDVSSLSNPNLNAWELWFQDEFTSGLSDWWEPSYLKWWNYSSESNEKYNQVEYSDAAGSNVLKQFITPDMRADSIVTRRDNFRNPGITLGTRDLVHNYGAKDLLNLQHVPVDDRGATAYGYFEIRAKITGGTTSKTQSGSSAWWFTGFQDAPWQTVEVDMVEYGYGVSEENLDSHFASPMHKWRDPFAWENNSIWNSTDKNLGVSKPADDYHVYGYEWTPTGMNGYFDGVLVWSKNVSVNYRMLMWLSLNSHAYDTYATDSKAHYIDYVRIWKTDELRELEKKLVTKNIVQKQAPVDGNVATLGYCGANGLRSSHYQVYDPSYMNDGDVGTSFKAMTRNERQQNDFPRIPYQNDDQFLYLDWVEYPESSVAAASSERETITDLDGKTYTLASEQEIQSPKTISSIEIVVNKNLSKRMISPNKSDNSKGDFVYKEMSETANLFPFQFDIEYSDDGVNGWTPIASDVTAQWNFNNEGIASYIVNVPSMEGIHHIRLRVKSVWNSDLNQEENTDHGFYVAEIKVYEASKGALNAVVKPYHYNHAPFAKITVTNEDGTPGSEDINFPVGDLADGVYVNEFRSSGDGERLFNHPNRVDITKENVPSFPQYIYFKWDTPKTIDSMGFNIGYRSSAPTSFALEALQSDGSWKTVVNQTELWSKDFEKKTYSFTPQTTSQMRLVISSANKGQAVEYHGGIEGDASRIVCIAGGYYSIAEVELTQIR